MIENSKIAFSDNASAINSHFTVKDVIPSIPYYTSSYIEKDIIYYPTLNAETHNFPTGICPFPGAATGVGGRIRDTQCIGRGGMVCAGLAGYSIGNLFLDFPWEEGLTDYGCHGVRAINILIEASNGASDYGNKFGEPLIGGFTRSYGNRLDYKEIENSIGDWCNNSFNKSSDKSEHFEYIKPIMYSAGLGKITETNLYKESPFNQALILKMGGPAYRIGIGGGAASSRMGDKKNLELDLTAVQRGDPQMENRLDKLITGCQRMGLKNPLLSLHDQGAGGMANVTKEIIAPFGSTINIDDVILGDDTMTPFEIWNAEYQEQNTALIHKKQLKLIEILAKRENVPISIIGKCEPTDKIKVINKKGEKFVDLNMSDILVNRRCKRYDLNSFYRKFKCVNHQFKDKQRFTTELYSVLQHPSVCSKRFLMNKCDRSVGGLVVQQQCVGPLHLPLSDYSIIAHSHLSNVGTLSAIGEQPIIGLVDPEAMVEMSISEMLLGMLLCKNKGLNYIGASGNWMWPNIDNNEKYYLAKAVIRVNKLCKELGIFIDGGKDSLSMSTKIENEIIKSPRTFVITGYTEVQNYNIRVTPNIKGPEHSLLLIYFGSNIHKLGGSIYLSTKGQLGNSDQMPRFENIDQFKECWNIIQDMIESGLILSGHDVSDGGVITTILEMCFGGNMGIIMNIVEAIDANHFFFSQEMAIVVETDNAIDIMNKLGHIVDVIYLGETITDNIVDITFNGEPIFFGKMTQLRNLWDTTSQKIEYKQVDDPFVIDDKRFIKNINFPNEVFPENFNIRNIGGSNGFVRSHKVGILRGEGSNSEKEMSAALYSAGFMIYDIHMNDIIKEPKLIQEFKGLAFVGGFTYSDVLGAAVGWSNVIKENETLWEEFQNFFKDKTKFSIGICNGCQLMGELGIVPYRFKENLSKRFESRWSYLKIKKTRSPFFKDMDGSILGVWSAHGEGRAIKQKDNDSVVAQYVDYDGNKTEKYPYNPNGSDCGVAACTSKSGRHLAIMSHPERSVFKYQVPWSGLMDNMEKTTPWYKMFTNIWDWSNTN